MSSERWRVGFVSTMDVAGISEMCSVRIRYSDNTDVIVDLDKLPNGEWAVMVTDLKKPPVAS